jgi:hypothetical protein
MRGKTAKMLKAVVLNQMVKEIKPESDKKEYYLNLFHTNTSKYAASSYKREYRHFKSIWSKLPWTMRNPA